MVRPRPPKLVAQQFRTIKLIGCQRQVSIFGSSASVKWVQDKSIAHASGLERDTGKSSSLQLSARFKQLRHEQTSHRFKQHFSLQQYSSFRDQRQSASYADVWHVEWLSLRVPRPPELQETLYFFEPLCTWARLCHLQYLKLDREKTF